MFRNILIIGVVLLAVAAGGTAYVLRQDGEPVYYRILEEPADALDAGRVAWLRQKDAQKGLHLYSLETGNPYELLVYDNSRKGENRYRTSALRATLSEGTLRIDIDDRDAVDDSFVNDTILAYFIIKNEPALVEVYRNGVREEYEMERGSGAISK